MSTFSDFVRITRNAAKHAFKLFFSPLGVVCRVGRRLNRRQGVFLSLLLILGGAAIIWVAWPKAHEPPPEPREGISAERMGAGHGGTLRKYLRGFRGGWEAERSGRR